MGKDKHLRLVSFNGREIEANIEGNLLILYNRDTPGMIGQLGTILGKDQVNIANLALSRRDGDDYAITVFELDDSPSKEATSEMLSNPEVENLLFIRV